MGETPEKDDRTVAQRMADRRLERMNNGNGTPRAKSPASKPLKPSPKTADELGVRRFEEVEAPKSPKATPKSAMRAPKPKTLGMDDISPADDFYEITGSLDQDVGVTSQAKDLDLIPDFRGSDEEVEMVDVAVQTDHQPGFGEVAPEVNNENILRLINRIRRNPKSMVPLLEKRWNKIDKQDRIMKTDGVFLQLGEGRKGVEECIRWINLQERVPMLVLSEELCKAAQEHVDDIGPKGLTGHTGSDGSITWDRVARHCEWRKACAENIDYMSTSAPEIVLSMLVDDDVPSRGHRKNIMKADFTKVGIAYGPHRDFGTVTVIVFAGWVGPKLEVGTRKAKANGHMTPELKELIESTPFGPDFGAQAAQRLKTGGMVSAEVKWDGKKGDIKVMLIHDGPKGRTTRTLKGQWKS